MSVRRLSPELVFPPVEAAEPDGMLAMGGDLSLARLELAYRSGIFPWYEAGQPILWWSPPVRPVLAPGEVHVGRTLSRVLRRSSWRISMDTACAAVIDACAATPRAGMWGTWITPAMRRAYTAWHQAGIVHSVEVWDGDVLIGGLYGVALGRMFFGESMFSHTDDASKAAFVALCRQLDRWGFGWIDSQVTNAHTARLGTHEIDRPEFVERVREWTSKPGREGHWMLDVDLTAASNLKI